MTREIRLYENSVKRKNQIVHGVHYGQKTRAKKSQGIEKRNGGIIQNVIAVAKGVCAVYERAVYAKRQFSDRFVYVSEVLADKTAREGLFGEDIGKGYNGTDVDYI